MLTMTKSVGGHDVHVCAATCKSGRWPRDSGGHPSSTDPRATTASPYRVAAADESKLCG
jgi:hypothetical protein